MREQQRLIIVGAGCQGSEVRSYILDLPSEASVRLIGFVDDHRPPGPWHGSRVLGDLAWLEDSLSSSSDEVTHYITAVGSVAVRETLVDRVHSLRSSRLTPWTLQHPRATVGYASEIGEGTCLAPGSVITTRVNIGRHCVVNVNASVSHDCRIGDFVNINPGAVIAGSVSIGRGCSIGAGATVIQNVSVGEGAVIGAGAVVITNIPPHVTAVGVPARVIKHHSV